MSAASTIDFFRQPGSTIQYPGTAGSSSILDADELSQLQFAELAAEDAQLDGVLMNQCVNWSLICDVRFNGDIEKIKDCFLSECFGLQTQEVSVTTTITVIYIAIFVTGVIGNLSVLVATKAGVAWLNNVTSAYLVNLAITNLVNVLAGLPFDIHLMWHQYPWDLGEFLCHFKGWLSETTTYVSVLTIVAFTFERYAAICHAFRIRAAMNRRVSVILGLIWVAGALCAVPYGLYHQLYTLLSEDHWPLGFIYGPIEKTRMCMLPIAFDLDLRYKFMVIMHWSMVTFFGLPLLIILICYTFIGAAIRTSQRTNSSLNSIGKTHCQNRQHKKALIILAAVVVAFFLCFAPYQAQRLLFFYVNDINNPVYRKINHYLYIISGVSFYLGSTVNPLLYNVISARFRKAFKQMLLCNFKFKPLSANDLSRKVSMQESRFLYLRVTRSRSAEAATFARPKLSNGETVPMNTKEPSVLIF